MLYVCGKYNIHAIATTIHRANIPRLDSSFIPKVDFRYIICHAAIMFAKMYMYMYV